MQNRISNAPTCFMLTCCKTDGLINLSKKTQNQVHSCSIRTFKE